MKVEEFVNIYRACGKMSDEHYNDIVKHSRGFYENYKDIELRKGEIEFLKGCMMFGSIRNVLYSLMEKWRKFYASDKEYDTFLSNVVRLNKDYENEKERSMILANVVGNSETFMKLKGKDLEFFKFCDAYIRMPFKVDKRKVYTDRQLNGEISGIERFRLVDNINIPLINDIVLITVSKEHKVKICKHKDGNDIEKVASILKKEIKEGLHLAIVNRVEYSRELFDRVLE